jgi:hypothetical protein
MVSIIDHLNTFMRFLFEQWQWISLVGTVLLLIWYRKTTSVLPARRASFVRR